MQKRNLSIRLILLLTVGTLTLLIGMLALRDIYQQWQQLEQIEALRNASVVGDALFETAEKLSVERDIAFTMIYADDPDTLNTLTPRLQEARQETNRTWNASLVALKQYPFPELNELREHYASELPMLQNLRGQIDEALSKPLSGRDEALAANWADQLSTLVNETHQLWTRFIKHFVDINPIVTQHLRYKLLMYTISDYNSYQRALISRALVRNRPLSPEEMGHLMRWQGVIEHSWAMIAMLAEHSGLFPILEPYYKDAHSHYVTMYDMVKDILSTTWKGDVVYPLSPELWLEIASQVDDSLGTLKNASLIETRRYVETLRTEANRKIALRSLLLIVALLICGYSFRVISHRVIHPVNQMVEALILAIQGKTVASFPSYANRKDEIGKLAQVLEAMQDNMEEIRRTSRELKQYTMALEHSNKELDDFAYIASHDLKEPLRGIHNHSRFLLEDNEEKLDPESVNRLHRLVHLSQRMEKLVNDLLYFSRLGRQELAIQPADLNEVVHDIENTLDEKLAERNVSIRISGTLPTVTCDKTRITEALRNLITNAVKYNDKEKKDIEIGFLENVPGPNGENVRNACYVKDNGCGIDKEFYEEVFRIFKRLQPRTGEAEEGTGAGLTFVKKIIERHGGRIWLTSTLGEGTTFYFTLEGEKSEGVQNAD